MSDSKSIRVLVADDHAATREDLIDALLADPGFTVCGEAADAPAAVELAAREHPDVCLLDVNMPGWGVAAAWEIRSRLPETKLIMMTVSKAETDVLGSLRAGADGYLLKDMDFRGLPRAIRSVLAGEVSVPRELVGLVVEGLRDNAPRRREVLSDGVTGRLTSREWQVLDLLRQDFSTAAIASRLGVSPVTVRRHINEMLKKYGVSDRAELLQRFEDGPSAA